MLARRLALIAGLTPCLFADVCAAQCYVSTVLSTQPVFLAAPQVTYDSARSRIILTDFSNSVYVQLRAWIGSSWAIISPGGPSPRVRGAIAYDSVRDRVVAYGGLETFTYQPDVWEWNGQAWSMVVGQTGVLGRAGHAMVYDAARQRTVAFGGERSGEFLNEVMLWDGFTWTIPSPPVRPSPRAGAAMAYDSARQRVVMMGGIAPDGTVLADVWEWDGALWIQRATGPALSPRSIAYNPERGRVFFLGGPASTGGQAWEFDGAANSWARLADLGPGYGGNRPMVFDATMARVVACSGGSLVVWDHHGTDVPPWIAAQPEGSLCTPGAPAAVSIGVGGNNLTYQWHRAGVPVVNGGNISGATSPQLYFDPFLAENVGAYHAVVENACATVVSNTVTLSLLPVNPGCGSVACYANCDRSTGCPRLTANDFTCFIQRLLAGESYADCDGVGGITAGDFVCFLTAYNNGCS